jgi:hypothetical protein
MSATKAPTTDTVKMPMLTATVHKLRREFSRVALQANTLRMLPAALMTQGRFLFILGHMRSGSTLLCHLLCSSSDIIGFGETHINYRHRSDLAKLLMSVRIHTGKNPMKYRYVLDKIVGVQHIINSDILTDPRTRYIFLVREPIASLGSIVAMRKQFHNESYQALLAFATRHYKDRLKQLVQLATSIGDPDRCLALTHYDLLAETPVAFKMLAKFLGLSTPLSEEYDIMSTTGRPGIGDPSPNIRLGRISRSLPQQRIALSDKQRDEVVRCYETSIKRLREIIQPPVSRYPTLKKAAA